MTPQLLALLLAAGAPAQPFPDETTAPEATPSEPEAPETVDAPATPPPRFTAPKPALPEEPAVQLVRDDPDMLRERLEWHDKRDKDLRNLTVGFGIATIALGLLGAPMIATAPNADTAGKAQALTSGGAAALTFAGAATIGMIITGVVLGNHRNHRGFFL